MTTQARDIFVKTGKLLTLVLALGLTPILGMAQESEEPKDPRENRLPEPLDAISSNLKDIEKSGYFKISKGEYGRTDVENEEALIWTLTAIKPITYRHAEWLIQRYRDVRFYEVPDGSAQEVLTKLMYYSERVSHGAANNRIFWVDNQVKLWVPLDEDDVRLLRGLRANKVVFRRFRP
jgi:hypothetical protein